MSAATTKAQKIIDDNAVAVFSKSYCPYCKATKATLSELGAKFYAIELDQVGMLRPRVLPSAFGEDKLTMFAIRRWCGSPGRARGHQRPALCPQHLHCAKAYRRQLGSPGQEVPATGASEGGWRSLDTDTYLSIAVIGH